MIFGVCEWLAPRLDVEPKILRIAFVISVLLAGFGIGLYFILWLVKILSK